MSDIMLNGVIEIINSFYIDLTGCETKLDVHGILKSNFDFPEYYGNNLDALWDELSSRYSKANPLSISFFGTEALSDELKQYLSIINEIIDRVDQI